MIAITGFQLVTYKIDNIFKLLIFNYTLESYYAS